ncbi:uncharacterized protein LOC123316575 [Coccinella septempunctata]|uniref:uncharacterized protein LOC123316575 n=1 Tax=Coccinella septempunctata TaxID=41139 RepID=UPI001D07A6D0|nr:uncharacterized protein LOC123316575 [Coccinella septempunctata]
MKYDKEEEKKQKEAGKLWKSRGYGRRVNNNKMNYEKEPIPSNEQKAVITMKNKDYKKKTINEIESGTKGGDQQLILKLKSILEKKRQTKMERNKQENSKKKEQETFEPKANSITNLSESPDKPEKNKRTTKSSRHKQLNSKSNVTDKKINKLDLKRTDSEQKKGIKVKHKTIKKYITPSRESSLVKSNTKKDSIKLPTFTNKYEGQLSEFNNKNSQNIPKEYSKHKQFSVIKLTEPTKDQILYDTKFTDTTMDESASLRKKTKIRRDKYISPYSAKGTSSFIPNVGTNEIETKTKNVVKDISCETVDSLFGLGYLLEGRITECNDKKLATLKEQQTKDTPPIYGKTMSKTEIVVKPKIELLTKESCKCAPIMKDQVISQEKIMKGKCPPEKPLNNTEKSKIYVKQSNIKHEESGKSNSRHSSILVRGVDLSISRHHRKRRYSISLNDQLKNSIMDTQNFKRKQPKGKDYIECNKKKLNMDTDSFSIPKEKIIINEISKRPTKPQIQQKNLETATKNIDDSMKDQKLKENKFEHTNKAHSYPDIRLKAQRIVDSLLEESIKAIEQRRRKLDSNKNIRIEKNDEIKQHKELKPEQHDENDKNKINYAQKEKIDLNESKTQNMKEYSKLKEYKSSKHFKGEITESKKQETDQNSELKEPKLMKNTNNKKSSDLLVPKSLDANTDSKLNESKLINGSDKKMSSVHIFKPASSVRNRSNLEESTGATKDSKAKIIISSRRTDPQKSHQKREIEQYALKFVDDILKEGLKKARERSNTRVKTKTGKISKSDSNEGKLHEYRRKKTKPEKSCDRKLSWAEDEIDVAKLAKYADILEDISLDRAKEMEDILSKPSPSMNRKRINCSKRKGSNESTKYKVIDIDEAWSSSSLKTPVFGIKCCKKTTDGSSASISHGPLNVFKRRRNFGERRLFVPSSKQDISGRKVDRTSIRVSVVPEEHPRGSDYCGNIELKRVRGIQSIRPCLKHISQSIIRDDSGNICVSVNASKETQRVQSNTKTFTRRRQYLELGECIKVPSTSSGSFRSRKKISDNASYDESLSNVLGPIVTSTESDVSYKFFSACDIPQDPSLCGCAVSENIIEENEASWSKICCSKATKNLSGTTEKDNRINNSSSSKNFKKKLTRSISEKINLRRILEGETSSGSEDNIVRYTIKNSNGKDRIEGRRTSERSVRFEQCIGLRKKETNSLNLRKECGINKRSINNICSGSDTLDKKRMTVSLPKFPSSMCRETKIDETNGIERFFNGCPKYFSTYYSENLLDKSFPVENRQISSFSLMIGNFNTEIIEVVKDEGKHRPEISQTFLKQNDSLQSISRCLQGPRNDFGKIISYISFGKTETIKDFLFNSSISLELSKSFTLDKNCFSALLDILTTSEQQILNVQDSKDFNKQFLQGYTFNNRKISYLQKNPIFSKAEKEQENSLLPSLSRSSDFKQIPKRECSKPIKMRRKTRRKLFDRYEKQRSLLLRKERKTKNEVYLPVINIKGKSDQSSESERDVSLHKSSTFYSKTALGSSSDIEKVKPGDIRRLTSAKIKSDLQDSSMFHAKTFIVPDRSLKHPPNIVQRNYNKNTRLLDDTSRVRDVPNPYKNDQFIYHASVEVQPKEKKGSLPSKEPKRKLTCKEATKKMFGWFKTLGVSQKTQEVAKKKPVDPLIKTEGNLLKQRKVLRSKLRYPKANASTLYLHKREYNQKEQDPGRISLFGRIDPVLREIASSEIIEPQLEEEELETSSSEDDFLAGERKRDRQKDGRLIVFSEDSMVLFERKKVYDRLQRYGKLFYTIYLNEEEDDMDHVSIRSAESMEHRIECEDKPFFATYDLGANDVRVHVTKDTFEGKKRENIYKDENFVECQNSQVKLSLMRGKRYIDKLDPTKAKIIEIDCTNQFSEIKICYRKTEKSEECVCEQPDTCKAVQLESSELSSVDVDREDKSQETHEMCVNCEECQDKPETCENYDECTKGNICSMKRKATLGSVEDVNTVEFFRIPQGFGFPRNVSDEDSDGYETDTDSNENDSTKGTPRRAAFRRSRQKYRYYRRRQCSKVHKKKR